VMGADERTWAYIRDDQSGRSFLSDDASHAYVTEELQAEQLIS